MSLVLSCIFYFVAQIRKTYYRKIKNKLRKITVTCPKLAKRTKQAWFWLVQSWQNKCQLWTAQSSKMTILKIYIQQNLFKADTGQKFLSALERCPPWSGLNWKVPKFKVQLDFTGPTLTWTPPPYLTIGMWNGEKVNVFVMYQFILHQTLK